MSGLKKSRHLKLPFKDIEIATKSFETCIGKGGYGWVYKGELSIAGKPTTVAVKRLNEQFGQGLKEFLTEVDLLTGQQHPNIISLLGYCDDGKEKIIVYEYAERGSLDQYLSYSNTTYKLTWLERLKVCIDVARGLDHLHSHVGEHQCIIHRDIKSANILLDENWVAKISDLGLSKLSLAGLDRSVVISHVCGTSGYCEPEYITTGTVTKKSDVYSFGMVLFEVLCGRLALRDNDGISLTAKLAKECYRNKKLDEIIDPSLRIQMSANSISKYSAIAYGCLHDDREQRPSVDVVKKVLEETLKIQLSGDRITEVSPMDEQTVAVESMVVPTIQVDEKEITNNFGTKSLFGEGSHKRVFHGFSSRGHAEAVRTNQPNKEFLAQLSGDRITEVSPMDTQTIAVQSQVVPTIQVDEMELTDNFGTNSLIGEGSHTRVYHGFLIRGHAAADRTNQANKEFRAQLSGDCINEVSPMDTQNVAVQSMVVSAILVDESKEITDNFGTRSLIGGGSHSRLYHGVLSRDHAAADRSNQPNEEFLAQIAWEKSLIQDIVIIRHAEIEGEVSVITINCPDKIGLGCDLCRTILYFGLSIVRGDLSTDGKWCYIVFWVDGKPSTRWSLLKKRLMEACPSVSPANTLISYPLELLPPKPADVFLLEFCCHDRQGLLHDVTRLLCELELVIQSAKVSTTPDGMVMDLFFVTDTRELLHTAKRKEDTHDHLKAVFGDAMISCDIEMVGPDFTACSHGPPSFIPPTITEDTFNLDSIHSNGVSVTVDNSLSPAHTLVQIVCPDHKGLLYDIMRTFKDYNIQISYGRFMRKERKVCEFDFFIVQADGKKIVDPSKQTALCSRIRMELFQPLRVVLMSRGPDTELIVANPVELCGKGRPLVFYDITLALKMLNMDIFSAEISRHLIGDRVWEVHRVLLDEGGKLSVPKGKFMEAVWKMLMSWD